MKRDKTITKHHRKPKSLGGEDRDFNISMVNDKKHQSWHNLFDNKEPHEIAKIINNIWLDPDFEFIVRRR